jgi:hypothetical protein
MALKYHTRLNREEPQNAIEEEFINSCSLHKLEQLFTWGFVQALEMAPQNEHNKETLSGFIKTFDTISFYYPVEHLLQTYKELEITFQPGEYVHWDAHFITYSHQAVNYKNFLAKLKK